MEYKKLLKINYKHKTFLILMDKNYHKTFLEENSEGKLIYPEKKDYIILNNIFNNRNPFISFLFDKFTYKEKVRFFTAVSAVLLTVNVLSPSLTNVIKTKLESISSKNSFISFMISENYYFIKDIKVLDELLGKADISYDLVLQAINDNDNLNDNDKEIAKNLLDYLTNNYPNYNLRVFYENIKTIKIERLAPKELTDKFGCIIDGCYDASQNTIYLSSYAYNDVFYHELLHASHSIFIKKGKDTYFSSEIKYEMLDEGIIDCLTDEIIKSNHYKINRSIYTYLSTLVDFTFEEYSNKGLTPLINKLKQKYPNIEIDTFIESLNTYNDGLTNLNINPEIENYPEITSTLFEICKSEISLNDPYKSLKDFTKAINLNDIDIFYNYLEEYNKLLKERGYETLYSKSQIENNISFYNNIIGYCCSNNVIFPIIQDENQTEETLDDLREYKCLSPNNSIITVKHLKSTIIKGNYIDLIKQNIIKNFDIINTFDFYKELFLSKGLITIDDIEPINVTYNNKTIENAFSKDLTISYGKDIDNKAVYIIKNNGKIIFASSNNPLFLSEENSLAKTIKQRQSDGSCSIEDILINYQNIENFDITDSKHIFFSSKDLSQIRLKRTGKYKIYLSSPIDYEFEIKNTAGIDNIIDTLTLKDILDYYSITLLKDNEDYEYTYTALKVLLNNYFTEYVANTNIAKEDIPNQKALIF